MGTPAPDAVKRLVDRFDQNRKVFQSGDYKEEQLRAEFLNPPKSDIEPQSTQRFGECGAESRPSPDSVLSVASVVNPISVLGNPRVIDFALDSRIMSCFLSR